MAEPPGVWVYAVAERVAPAGLGQLSGVGGGRVRALPGPGLTAVVSDVPLAEFGESALRRNLEDLGWLEATAREHHAVIEAVAQQGPVVPMRLATVYRDDPGVTVMLAEQDEGFRAALSRTRARKEWGVKAYAARPAAPGGQPAPAGQSAGLSRGQGMAYLQRRRAQLSAQKNARGEAMASAQAVHDTLSRLAAESRLHPPQAPQLSGSKAQMILNAAYLLDDERTDEFAAAVTTLAQQHPGVRLELTGPWPPYSFASPEEERQTPP